MSARSRSSFAVILGVFAIASCNTGTLPPSSSGGGVHSSSMALTPDGHTLFVANPDADSVSVVNVMTGAFDHEILLAAAHPAVDTNGHYTPAVMPRDVALSPNGSTLYVSGERAGALLAIDLASGKTTSVSVGSEPLGVLVSNDGASIYVACSQDNTIVRVDAASLIVKAIAHVPNEPWALAWSKYGSTLLATHLLGPGVTSIDPSAMTVRATWTVPDTAPRGDSRLAHGQVRGIYDVVARPGTNELWIAHAMLGTDTAQPSLNFESTAFPSLSVLQDNGTYVQTLSTDAQDIPGVDGAFSDVVSGPQAIAFTHDGKFALVVDTNSGDVMVVDAEGRLESSLVRPLPGTMPTGIVISPDEKFAYVDERVTSDVAVLTLDRSTGVLVATVTGAAISRLPSDPMPMQMRLGQELFNSANSSAYPLTTDHWISCATCHMEGRSDAVTWDFAQGPRDTPSNAGGMLDTGFLFRTADRNKVQDYWHTINTEQGGRFDETADSALLDAIATYVNYALPLPMPPTTDAALVARGAQVFAASGCTTCHSGPRLTDSGSGNPNLDLSGTILLHDVGTCVTTGYPDVAHDDVNGDPRAACMFDTPSLSGIASTPPYLHDGSAATLADATMRMPTPPSTSGSPSDLDAVVEYMRSL